LLAEKVAVVGNTNALSDAGVAALTANAGAKAAYLNVMINMAGINDENFKKEISGKAKELWDNTNKLALAIENDILGRL
jgi:formiminotetrahydrofolate cyclodeaminase